MAIHATVSPLKLLAANVNFFFLTAIISNIFDPININLTFVHFFGIDYWLNELLGKFFWTDLRILHFLSDPQIPITLWAPSNLAICPAKIPHAPAAPETTTVKGLNMRELVNFRSKYDNLINYSRIGFMIDIKISNIECYRWKDISFIF